MAIYCTQQEVQDHCELVKLLKVKLSGNHFGNNTLHCNIIYIALITTVATTSSTHSSVPMTTESATESITEVTAVTNVPPEIANQSESLVSIGIVRYGIVCHELCGSM